MTQFTDRVFLYLLAYFDPFKFENRKFEQFFVGNFYGLKIR